ncbi:MAG: endolytic transglycosylase MltG [Coriobacteriales bacterium]|jgi:UPF0755 protein|nr:endolytic transglycosylase MltG [Coriobacteriales bacterium]
MAKYHGKHSRPSDDSSTLNELLTSSRLQTERPATLRDNQEQPAGDAHQTAEQRAVDAHQTAEHRVVGKRRKTAGPRQTDDARQTEDKHHIRSRIASPHAFKHHDSVHETGSRPRHSKLRTLFIVIPIVAVLAVAVVFGSSLISNLLTPEEIEPGVTVTVSIPDGASTDRIATILKEAKVIGSTQAFIVDVKRMGAEQSLKPGTYELETMMDTTTLINLLVSGPNANGNKLTIPEGLTAEQTAKVVEDACGIPKAEFLAKVYAADQYVAQYPFLEDVYNNSLEGFLYPKTYRVPENSSADYVIRMLLDQFALETKGLDLIYAQSHGMNLYYIVNLASLIEKETAVDSERALIASVIYNRLHEGMQLQIDATIVYALGPSYNGHLLTWDDLEVESPYNTYRYFELPAGPICSPSIQSIQAAAHPAQTDYLYYIAAPHEQNHNFFATSDEFEVAKEEYNLIMGIR